MRRICLMLNTARGTLQAKKSCEIGPSALTTFQRTIDPETPCAGWIEMMWLG
jgi:hypothetical protein